MTAAGVGSSSVPERDVTKDKLVQLLDEGAESGRVRGVAEGQHDHRRSDEAAAAGSNAAIA
jgi:hypothetical protein